ncbi:MAG TPA: succinylglutamate desuccinylase/aspartoacylase family protein [Candidatus Magasanikbacteria bacterium]|nr:succinylglutamate desuccinylase/aspartoacylase family protein [Candidatus Magasanikbacteria bacterium]
MSYYNTYLKKLNSVCKRKKLDLIEIGRVGFKKEYPIYKIVINPLKKGRVVCFSAGIHGYEIAGPWAVLEFLKKLNVEKLKNKLIIFPVANPSGFDKNIRHNWQRKNLNALFCSKKMPEENKILLNALKNEKVRFFHALHEDVEEKSFYLYNFEKKPEKIYRDIIKLAKKYFPINLAKEIYGDKSVGGLIINRADGSFEDRLFREGTPYSMCTETPGKHSLKKRVELSVVIMEKVIKFINKK